MLEEQLEIAMNSCTKWRSLSYKLQETDKNELQIAKANDEKEKKHLQAQQ